MPTSAFATDCDSDTLFLRISRIESRLSTLTATLDAQQLNENKHLIKSVPGDAENTNKKETQISNEQRIDAVENLLSTYSSIHSIDFDSLTSTLSTHFTRSHSRLTCVEHSLKQHEEQTRGYLTKFQAEFKQILGVMNRTQIENQRVFETKIRQELETQGIEAQRSFEDKIRAEISSQREKDLLSLEKSMITQFDHQLSELRYEYDWKIAELQEKLKERQTASVFTGKSGKNSNLGSPAMIPQKEVSVLNLDSAPMEQPQQQQQMTKRTFKQPTNNTKSIARNSGIPRLMASAVPVNTVTSSHTTTTSPHHSTAPTTQSTSDSAIVPLSSLPHLNPSEAALRIQALYRGYATRSALHAGANMISGGEYEHSHQQQAHPIELCHECSNRYRDESHTVQRRGVKRCKECGDNVFCKRCDEMIHKEGERKKHRRRYVWHEEKVIRDGNEGSRSSAAPNDAAAPSSIPPLSHRESDSNNGCDLILTTLEALSHGSKIIPPPFPTLRNQVASTSLGRAHVATLTVDGKVWIWSDDGQEPTLVLLTADEIVTQIASGAGYTLLLTRSGLVFSHDSQAAASPRLLGVPKHVIWIGTGGNNSGFICRAAGGSTEEEEGRTEVFMGVGKSPALTKVVFGADSTSLSSFATRLPQITCLAFGASHCLLISSAGHVYICNLPLQQQHPLATVTPHRIDVLDEHVIVDAVCGEQHDHFLTSSGSILSLARDDSSEQQHDHIAHEAILIDIPGIVRQITAAGSSISYAVTESGDVYSWYYDGEHVHSQQEEALRHAFVTHFGVSATGRVAALTTQPPPQESFRSRLEEEIHDETSEH